MNISIFTDLRFTESKKLTGVGKHIEHMIKGLYSNNDFIIRAIAASDQVGQDGRIPEHNILHYLSVIPLPLKWKTAEALWTLCGGPCVDKYCIDADWVYCPKNDFIPLKNRKLAVTIHGAPELDPDIPQSKEIKSRLNRIRKRMLYQRIADKADLIFVVSKFLKEKIIEWFGTYPEKIVVIGNGVEQIYFDTGKEKTDEKEVYENPYLLCVGGLNYEDGANDIIKFAQKLENAAPEIMINIAGWQHEDVYLDQGTKIRNLRLNGYLKSEDLSRVMKKSLGLLYLTNYETFGIAAAEAMAAGTPVITSGRTAVREIVGDAGIYVKPSDIDDTIEAVLHLVKEPAYRASVIEQGYKQAENYTWQTCTQRLIKALKGNSCS